MNTENDNNHNPSPQHPKKWYNTHSMAIYRHKSAQIAYSAAYATERELAFKQGCRE